MRQALLWSYGVPMGTGLLNANSGGTRIELRVAIDRWTAYAFFVTYLWFTVGACLGAAVLLAELGAGTFNAALFVLVLFLLLFPLALLVLSAGRRIARPNVSRESERILGYLRETIGAERWA